MVQNQNRAGERLTFLVKLLSLDTKSEDGAYLCLFNTNHEESDMKYRGIKTSETLV